MSGLMIMLPIALIIAAGFLVFFLWSVKNGDFEDPEMPAHRMILDDNDDADTSIVQKTEQKSAKPEKP
ncbi:MAG: cbb3-type cytochrome oxidase assembly protein CcoS [Leptospiraceae bacterium]|nr:cbb3-type cytochrome oxidase assembly protein CcoS [Leptospiraceae bacterium]MCB1199978.1 cbb3-type cytochrome oxidase assembly protein CcoS [Leptospiraceae bacterium]